MWLGVVSETSGEWSAPVLISGLTNGSRHCVTVSESLRKAGLGRRWWSGESWREGVMLILIIYIHRTPLEMSDESCCFSCGRAWRRADVQRWAVMSPAQIQHTDCCCLTARGKRTRLKINMCCCLQMTTTLINVRLGWGTLCACMHSYIINHLRFYSTSSRCKGYTQIYIETVFISCPQTKVRIVYILMYSYYAKHMFISCCTSQEPCPYSLSRGLSYILLYKVIGLTWGEYSDSLHVKIVNSPNIINPLTHHFPPQRTDSSSVFR